MLSQYTKFSPPFPVVVNIGKNVTLRQEKAGNWFEMPLPWNWACDVGEVELPASKSLASPNLHKLLMKSMKNIHKAHERSDMLCELPEKFSDAPDWQ